MTKKLETSFASGARPIACRAARTVSPVVLAAPPTVPSASPAGHAQRREIQRAPRDVSRFVERYAARAPPIVINLGVCLCAWVRCRILDRNVPQRHMQIRSDRTDDLFPAEQSDFCEAFPRDCRRSGNDARVFALRQHDALKARARASLDFLNQCHHYAQVITALRQIGAKSFPIVFQEQFLNPVSVEHVMHRQMAKHDENGIVRVFAMLGCAFPIRR